jgi:hypothetical protein
VTAGSAFGGERSEQTEAKPRLPDAVRRQTRVLGRDREKSAAFGNGSVANQQAVRIFHCEISANPVIDKQVVIFHFQIFHNPVRKQAVEVQNLPRPAAQAKLAQSPRFAGRASPQAMRRARFAPGS